jgi:hypothetical protein
VPFEGEEPETGVGSTLLPVPIHPPDFKAFSAAGAKISDESVLQALAKRSAAKARRVRETRMGTAPERG